MKIYILPVDKEFQSPLMPVVYPSHNINFKDGEEVFLDYIKNKTDCLTDDYKSADWHYLPIFWTHWMVTHGFGRVSDLPMLQKQVQDKIIDDSKTFTIHEYAEQPKVDIGKTKTFLGSRTVDFGFDIPLLCAEHTKLTAVGTGKKYLASFVGSLTTHPIRTEMRDELHDKILCLNEQIVDKLKVHVVSSKGTDYFIDTMLQSYFALCPRGYGGASYRFYEAMQLGVVPILIGDIDHRPFKKFLDWDSVSFFVKDVIELKKLLVSMPKDKFFIGEKVKAFYYLELANGNWCKNVLKELEIIK